MKIPDEITPCLMLFIELGYKVYIDRNSGQLRAKKSRKHYQIEKGFSTFKGWTIQELQSFEGLTSRKGKAFPINDLEINKL